MLKKRTFFSLTTFGGRLFAAGGVQTDKNEYFDSVECYDPLKNKWEFVSSMNRPRFLHAAFVHNHRLYVVGGAYGNIIESSLEYYEPSIDKWTVVCLIFLYILKNSFLSLGWVFFACVFSD